MIPSPTPIADAVLNFVVGSELESPTRPKGAASTRVVQVPLEHFLSPEQSRFEEQVALGVSDGKIELGELSV
jgi:hypothetical protein